MEMGQYPKRVTYPCELFDTESENDLAQGQQMPGAFKPPAPQAPVRYTCVQDLSEASLGSLLYCGRHSTPSIASTRRSAISTSAASSSPQAAPASNVPTYRYVCFARCSVGRCFSTRLAHVGEQHEQRPQKNWAICPLLCWPTRHKSI